MKINRIKIKIANIIRHFIVLYYKTLGVTVGKNVFISHTAKIDTTYPNSIFIGDNCYITGGS